MRNLITGAALWMIAAVVSVTAGVAAVTLVGPAGSSDVLNDEQVKVALEDQPSSAETSSSSPSQTDDPRNGAPAENHATLGGNILVACHGDEIVNEHASPIPGWDMSGPTEEQDVQAVRFTLNSLSDSEVPDSTLKYLEKHDGYSVYYGCVKGEAFWKDELAEVQEELEKEKLEEEELKDKEGW